jgi:hypothetical protein
MADKLDTIQVHTTADMQALSAPAEGQLVLVTDRDRGGLFFYDVVGAASDANNGITFAAANNKLWRRIYDGYVNVKWFGAKGRYDPENPTAFDDTDAIQAAIDFVAGTPPWATFHNGGGTLYLPWGVYPVRSLMLRARVTLLGDAQRRTTLKALPLGVNDPKLDLGDGKNIQLPMIRMDIGFVQHAHMRHLTLEGGTASTTAGDIERYRNGNPVRSGNATNVGQWAMYFVAQPAPTSDQNGGLWETEFEDLHITMFDNGIGFSAGGWQSQGRLPN